jgi:hypothetical protein
MRCERCCTKGSVDRLFRGFLCDAEVGPGVRAEPIGEERHSDVGLPYLAKHGGCTDLMMAKPHWLGIQMLHHLV